MPNHRTHPDDDQPETRLRLNELVIYERYDRLLHVVKDVAARDGWIVAALLTVAAGLEDLRLKL